MCGTSASEVDGEQARQGVGGGGGWVTAGVVIPGGDVEEGEAGSGAAVGGADVGMMVVVVHGWRFLCWVVNGAYSIL